MMTNVYKFVIMTAILPILISLFSISIDNANGQQNLPLCILDLIILLDTKLYLNKNDFSTTESGLVAMVNTIDNFFPISQTGTNIGLATYNSDGQLRLGLNQGTSLSAVTNAINQLQYSSVDSVQSNLKAGLVVSYNEFMQNSRNRTNAKIAMTILLFINSRMDDEPGTIIQANSLKASFIRINPVAISRDVILNPLRLLATLPSQVVYAPYDTIGSLWTQQQILQLIICGTAAYQSIKANVIGSKTIRVKKNATFTGKRYSNVICTDTSNSVYTTTLNIDTKTVSCLSIKKENPNAFSGLYNITVESLNMLVWCDMVSNGGGYTFLLNDANFDKLTQRTLDLLFTDKTHYLLALKKDTIQNYCNVTQLDQYSEILFKSILRTSSITIPENYGRAYNDDQIGPPYLYWPAMTIAQGNIVGEHGIKVNGKKASGIPTDSFGIEYMALFPKSLGASTFSFCYTWPMSALVFGNCDAVLSKVMPEEGFFFFEMHFTGGLSYTQTDGRADAFGVLAANIGFK